MEPDNNNADISPFQMIRMQQRAPKKANIIYSEDKICNTFVNYNRHLTQKENCISVTTKLSLNHKWKMVKCNCLSVLLVEETAVQKIIYESIAAYQVSFGSLSNTEQQFRVLEWMKYAKNSKKDKTDNKIYVIPFSTVNKGRRSVTEVMKNKICIHGLFSILGKKFNFYTKIRRHYNNNTTPNSSQKNNENARRKIVERGEDEELMQYLIQVETLAEPSATRLVREVTDTCTIRDNNDKNVYLPSNMSKRGVYQLYCLQRGKDVVTSHDGSISLKNIENRNNKKCFPGACSIIFGVNILTI